MTIMPALQPERTPVPAFDLVLVGAAGDLAMRKLLPALARRIAEGVIPRDSRIIGFVRSEAGDALRQQVKDRLREGGVAASEIDAMLRQLSFVSGDVSDANSVRAIGEALGPDTGRVRAYYMATPPDLFVPGSRALKAAGLLDGDERLVIEKPLGRDLDSARRINDALADALPESRTYRIDHYLGKEAVQNLLVLRFANTLFERSWSQRDIDHVQITVAETVGLETRAGYYDKVGALRDMVQNHVLQLLCLFAIEPPNALAANAVRDEKLRVLSALKPIRGADVLQRTVRGQYAAGSLDGRPVAGYRDELAPTAPPRPSPRSRSRSRTGAGPACRSTCAPASAWRPAIRRSWSSSSRCHIRFSRASARSTRSAPTGSSSACSPTTACSCR